MNSVIDDLAADGGGRAARTASTRTSRSAAPAPPDHGENARSARRSPARLAIRERGHDRHRVAAGRNVPPAWHSSRIGRSTSKRLALRRRRRARSAARRRIGSRPKQVSADPPFRGRNDEPGRMDDTGRAPRRIRRGTRPPRRSGAPQPPARSENACRAAPSGWRYSARYFRLGGSGVFRRVARVDADRDEAEVAAGIERQPVERRNEPSQRHAAQGPAAQIFEHQHDRLAGEKRRERTRAALLVVAG